MVSLPLDGSVGSIETLGNAAVANNGVNHRLQLAGGAREIGAGSRSGGFAIARVREQRDTKTQYFDFLFGTKGQPELVDESGRKQRSHVALAPDGNGKFLRLEGEGCEIKTSQLYLPTTQRIVPSRVEIRSPQFTEVLVVEFQLEAVEKVVELLSMSFQEL